MNARKLREYLRSINEPEYRFTQVAHAIYKVGVSSFAEIDGIPLRLRSILANHFNILSFKELTVAKEANNSSFKALLRLSDDLKIETVLMNTRDERGTVCVSTQVGCPIGCAFCATGKVLGFGRNLNSEEITDQVLFWKQYIKKYRLPINLRNIVYMGMGEPFANLEETFASLRDFTDSETFGIGDRHISVSTSGIIPGIDRLAAEFPQVNLAISLHSADNELRNRLVPINKTYPIPDLFSALERYIKVTNKKIFLEYTLLAGINDRKEDAEKLAELIYSTDFPKLFHVNLIAYNPTDTGFKKPSMERIMAFKAYLVRHKIFVTLRKSLGEEILGACGQLAGDRSSKKIPA